MSVPVSDSVKLLLSVPAFSWHPEQAPGPTFSGYSAPQERPWESYGRYCSTTQVECGTNHLFDMRRFSYEEMNDGQFIDYRCIFVMNDSPTFESLNVTVWFSSEIPGGSSLDMGLDPTPASHRGSGGGLYQSVEVPHIYAPPPGVAFARPLLPGAGLVIPLLPWRWVRAVWLRRTVVANADPAVVDGASIALMARSG